ncbi:squalene/phytoene synthase family protein [Candidatus Portiera aleyrodidarum]|uniref:Phytoene synthase n=1 Tax=Candidatus Portiera aleyrodidarum TaxID=91844 RepID=A0A8D9JSM5_9GAMM|nr:squalene/phytoene synthase family protein [Candidatus Portiera aleyrodidarum]CEI58802.1 Phytoene synthase [Candidatus Portiera aleyrodidarum]
MNKKILKSSNKIIKKYSKNFYFTSFFIIKKYSKYLKIIYFICRKLDEIADKNYLNSKKKSLKRLTVILKQIKNNSKQKLDKLSKLIKNLKKNKSINLNSFIDLINCLIKDIKYPANIKNEKELIYYCYGVAGTIGNIVLPFIKCSITNTIKAINLGIFLQMINIARDVLEDAFKGRRYLPACWVNNINAKEIIYLSNIPINKKHKLISSAIIRLLFLSEYYYIKGIKNIYKVNYINRIIITIISSIYYKININISNTKYYWIYKRIYISLYYKIFITLKTIIKSIC